MRPKVKRFTFDVERVFGTREFFRLWIAQLISATGDWLGLLATIDLADRISGEGNEGAAIALVLATRVVPGLFLATAAGVLIDKLERKHVMVCCDLGRAAVLVTLPFVDTLVGLVIASFLLEMLTLMWQPAKEATVPSLVPSDKLAAANSLNLLAAYGMFPVAAGLSAILAKIAGTLPDEGSVALLRMNEEGLAFYLDALSFLLTALIIWRLAIPKNVEVARLVSEIDEKTSAVDVQADDAVSADVVVNVDAALGVQRVPAMQRVPTTQKITKRMKLKSLLEQFDLGATIREVKDGWQLICSDPTVRAVNMGLATALMGGGMLVPLGTIFVNDVMQRPDSDHHILLLALGTGVAAGVLTAVTLTSKLSAVKLSYSKVFAGSLIGAGVCLFLAATMSKLPLVLMFITGLGFLAGPVYVLGFTLLQQEVINSMRGRVFAALFALTRLCLLISLLLAPLLTTLFDRLVQTWWEGEVTWFNASFAVPGVRVTIWLAALIVLAAGVLSFWSLRSVNVRYNNVADLPEDQQTKKSASQRLYEGAHDVQKTTQHKNNK